MDYEIDEDEVILYEGSAEYVVDEEKTKTEFKLTNKKMIFEKKKGAFKKEKELVDIVALADVKIHNDQVQCKQKFTELEIQTKQKKFSIVFDNIFNAIKVWNLIVDNITGTDIINRGLKKARNSLEYVDETLDLVDDAKGTLAKGIIGKKRLK